MYKKSILIILILILTALAACSPTAVEETAQEAETTEDTLRRVTEVAEPAPDNSDDTTDEIATEESEVDVSSPEVPDTVDEAPETPIDESLAKLPGLANSQAGIGGGGPASLPPAQLGGAGGESIASTSSDVEDGIAGSMMIDPFNMFEQTEFILNAQYPETPSGQIAIERMRSLMTADLARQIARDFQFSDQLFQQQLPLAVMEDVRIGPDGTFEDMPFFSFADGRQLVITTGSVWISYSQTQNVEAFVFDAEDFSQEELIAQTEQMLATFSFIDFEYTLRAEPFGSVLVIPSYEGISANSPLMGFHYTLDQAKSPVLQSLFMDLYSNINIVGDYPVLSADAAWQGLQAGLENGTVNWYFSGAPIPVEPDIQIIDDIQPQFWLPTHDVGPTVNLYGYPTVYNPVGQDGIPIVLLDGTVIQGPADIGLLLATSESGLFKFTGQYLAGEAGGKTFVAEGVVPLGYEDQLFIQGVVVQEGGQLFVDSPETGRILLNNAPADLPDGLELFVNGYRNGESADGTPIVDWQYIDEVIDYGEYPIAEPIPVEGGGGIGDGAVGLFEEGFGVVTIDSIELGYGVSWPQSQFDEESGLYEPVNSDYLIPVWRFSGQTADGMEITFEIPAVDEGYFAQS